MNRQVYNDTYHWATFPVDELGIERSSIADSNVENGVDKWDLYIDAISSESESGKRHPGTLMISPCSKQ